MTWLGVTANYGPEEHALMQRLRANGASRDELVALHLIVGLFDAHLQPEPRVGVTAIVDEREHYRQRNTSLVRPALRYEKAEPEPFEKADPQEERPALFDERQQPLTVTTERETNGAA